MLNKHYTNKIIFLNIETVPQKSKFEELSSAAQELFLKRHDKEYHERTWTLRSNSLGKEERKQVQEDLYSRNAALSAEWGRIACISLLVMNDKGEYGVKSFTDPDEKKLLETFLSSSPSIRDWKRSNDSKVVCSYNGFGFTFPFIAKRFLLNGLFIPAMFDYSEAKPWKQDQFISLMDIWSFNKSSYTSLETLAHCLGIHFITGGENVARCFELDKEALKTYSESKVMTLTNCYLKIKGQPILTKK